MYLSWFLILRGLLYYKQNLSYCPILPYVNTQEVRELVGLVQINNKRLIEEDTIELGILVTRLEMEAWGGEEEKGGVLFRLGLHLRQGHSKHALESWQSLDFLHKENLYTRQFAFIIFICFQRNIGKCNAHQVVFSDLTI